MSVLSEVNRTAELATDGVETEFDFSLLIYAESELQVWYKVTGGDYSLLTLNSDYTVIFGTVGGTITTTGGSSPFAAGSILMIRHLPITQQTNWLYNDNHSEQTHQDDFDRSVMIDLQIQEQLDRTIGYPTTDDPVDFGFPEPVADLFIGWTSDASGLENKVVTATVMPALSEGSIPFGAASGLYTQDNDNLFFDATNIRMGIKTKLPRSELDVVGTVIMKRLMVGV